MSQSYPFRGAAAAPGTWDRQLSAATPVRHSSGSERLPWRQAPLPDPDAKRHFRRETISLEETDAALGYGMERLRRHAADREDNYRRHVLWTFANRRALEITPFGMRHGWLEARKRCWEAIRRYKVEVGD